MKEENKTAWSGNSPLYEALTKFQQMKVSAMKDGNNPYFKSSYATLESVINAVNHGADFGLSFSQTVNYDLIRMDVEKTLTNKEGTTQVTKSSDLVKDIHVTTTIFHHNDEKTLISKVPVLINSEDKDNPQKLGSSITYAKRYGLQALYGLGSDDDGNMATHKQPPKTPINPVDKKEIIPPEEDEILTPPQPPKEEGVQKLGVDSDELY